MKRYDVRIGSVSEKSPARSVNQDAFFYRTARTELGELGVFAVADGIGGLANGDVASRIAVAGLERWWNNCYGGIYGDVTRLEASLREEVHRINREIAQTADGKAMGTTLALLVLCGAQALLLNVGDSRIYSIDEKTGLRQLTVDHSTMVQRSASDGTLFYRSVLTSCLMGTEPFEIATRKIRLEGRERFVLCSDGIYKTASDKDLLEMFSGPVPEQTICSKALSAVRSRAEQDDVTALVISLV